MTFEMTDYPIFDFGTFKCEVCGEKVEAGKWENETMCISCKVDYEFDEVQHICKDCGWKGSKAETKRTAPTKETADFSYNLCPKCDCRMFGTWCGKVDDWGG